MRIQPDHLLALAYVDRTGSLTQAAKALDKTQPAISAQLKALALAVGEPVLVRRRYGVELTVAGKALLPAGQSIARSLEAADEIRGRLQGLEHGTLRLLTSTSVAVYVLPPVLALFHERYPAVTLELRHSNPDEAVEKLAKGGADVVVLRGPIGPHSGQFVSSTVFNDRTVLAARPDHPLARSSGLRMKDLNGLEIVSRGANSPTRKLVEELARRAGVTLRIKFEVETIEGIKEAVMQGFGCGFVSRLAIAREVRNGQMVGLEVNERSLIRQIVLMHPSASQASPRVLAFLMAFNDVAPTLGGRGPESAATRISRRPRTLSA